MTLLALLLPALSPPAYAESALFLGNSFTFAGELDQATLALLQEGDPEWADGEVQRLAEGGLALPDHQERVASAGTEWELALGESGPAWSWVILQDQSQIPGFPETEPYYQASLDSAVFLDACAEARGARTLFFLTWGYREGDEYNPEIYADFEAMQDRLADGYAAYRDAASGASEPAWIAPVGPAFALAWEREVESGVDPLSPESRFYRLYADDGQHPSTLGTYLAAAVFYATMTGRSPEGLGAGALTDPEDAAWAQSVAADTVFDSTLGYTYPWTDAEETGETGDTGPSEDETGVDESGAGDSSGEPAETGTPKEGGCGCASGGSAGSWGLLALLCALGARRRR